MTWSRSGNGGEGDEGVVARGPGLGRRRDDHPDWKAVAPRWLLVIIAALFAAMVTAKVAEQIALTARTAAEVRAVAQRTEALERGFAGVELELAVTRVDMLAFQLYIASRQKSTDPVFMDDLRTRLGRARTRAELLEQRQGIQH